MAGSSQRQRKIGVIDLLTPGDFATTILLYGPPGAGKSVLVADDLPDDNTIIVDTTKTFNFANNKKRVVTTYVEEAKASIVTGMITVIDDTFVFNGNEIKQMMRKALEVEARLILISQIRTFREPNYYPYMSHIVENANLWLKMERREIRNEKLYSTIQLVRKRGEWVEDKPLKTTVAISDCSVDDETYKTIDNIQKLTESKEK